MRIDGSLYTRTVLLSSFVLFLFGLTGCSRVTLANFTHEDFGGEVHADQFTYWEMDRGTATATGGNKFLIWQGVHKPLERVGTAVMDTALIIAIPLGGSEGAENRPLSGVVEGPENWPIFILRSCSGHVERRRDRLVGVCAIETRDLYVMLEHHGATTTVVDSLNQPTTRNLIWTGSRLEVNIPVTSPCESRLSGEDILERNHLRLGASGEIVLDMAPGHPEEATVLEGSQMRVPESR